MWAEAHYKSMKKKQRKITYPCKLSLCLWTCCTQTYVYKNSAMHRLSKLQQHVVVKIWKWKRREMRRERERLLVGGEEQCISVPFCISPIPAAGCATYGSASAGCAMYGCSGQTCLVLKHVKRRAKDKGMSTCLFQRSSIGSTYRCFIHAWFLQMRGTCNIYTGRGDNRGK